MSGELRRAVRRLVVSGPSGCRSFRTADRVSVHVYWPGDHWRCVCEATEVSPFRE